MDSKQKTYMVCFWVAVAVIVAVFVIPVDSHTVQSGNGSEVTISYTLWNKIAGTGNTGMEFRFNH